MNKVLNLSAAVLAGGASSRMGEDKSLLTLQGERLIERVVYRLEALTKDVMVVTNSPAKYNFLASRVRFVRDITGPGQGPLAGIASALEAAKYERVLLVATDMPFLDVSLLNYLANLDHAADVVVPVIADDGYPETLHAIYRKSLLPLIEGQLAAGHRKITRFFSQVHVRKVSRDVIKLIDPTFLSFFNANTPEEWAEVEEWVTNG